MSDYQQRLTAARDAVVEAAEEWVEATEIIDAVRKARELRDAVANLRAVEKKSESGS